jgi:hypothetical protein
MIDISRESGIKFDDCILTIMNRFGRDIDVHLLDTHTGMDALATIRYNKTVDKFILVDHKIYIKLDDAWKRLINIVNNECNERHRAMIPMCIGGSCVTFDEPVSGELKPDASVIDTEVIITSEHRRGLVEATREMKKAIYDIEKHGYIVTNEEYSDAMD